MKIIGKDILAVKLDLDCDYEKITQEIIDCKQHWLYIPPYKYQLDNPLNKEFEVSSEEDFNNIDYTTSTTDFTIVNRNMRGAQIFYLRENSVSDSQSFSVTKKLPHDTWKWKDYINAPYTKQFIDSLPFTKLGMVRVFVFKDTFLPVHRDYQPIDSSNSNDVDKCLGLSIIPSTGGVPMKIWSQKLNKVVTVPGNAMLFNDSVFHAVPKTTGYRITIRIFGEIDYGFFSDKVDPTYFYYL